MLLAQETAEFVGPEVGWFALSPLLVLTGGALFLLLAGALTPTWPRGLYALTTVAVSAAAAVLAVIHWHDIADEGPSTLVGEALAFDKFAMYFTVTICVAIALVSLMSDDYLRREGIDGPEYYAMYLVAGLGGIVMASANDLIVLFIALETLSLGFYVLAAGHRRRTKSQEAGIKYFVLGGFSSAFLLYGVALIYGVTGSTRISTIITSLQENVPVDNNESLILAGVALMIMGLGFKVAAAPFHIWLPDIYEGAPSPVTAFIAAAGKAAAFGALVRVLVVALPFYRDDWRPVIWALAIASLIVGGTKAIVQTNVKRLLAYSWITHAGFILVGLEAAGHTAGEADGGSGVQAVAVYLLIYAVLISGSFGVISLVSRTGDDATSLTSFRGLAKRQPVLAIALTIFLLAQAGVPFTSGFVAKFSVIQAAVEESSYAVAIVAMLAAVIAAFLYLRIIVSVWMSSPADADGGEVVVAEGGGTVQLAGAQKVPFLGALGVAAAALFTLAVGILPNWLLDVADTVSLFAR